ncbi:MAG TPA: N-acetylmuramoyl-L-alanine amidase [Candidatus Sumerlaeota bacterium]|nr:N-acetylmuramoyl-L-alanine amidase [Candidatus Sumerlaeota bacterium]HRR30297.1 N-acetylmuramoyl-L-alanine amidase [Candidatus Sumerlaeia bacterium]HON49225.1 N-acetylmuramoyl-L-alanine amidase [Candidatus Sumerlaeota bacterium]HOR64168.1 N-acetylmuramoyl-L-alanine amidase [Candidatus Sumerlaeota bacterium]HPL73181.1 N-acetylmuramoyl-L-alanine amidase [Candidatus Sumerlaeota bacterium]
MKKNANRLVLTAVFIMMASLLFAAGSFPQPGICTRSCWGARSPKSVAYMSALNRAVIHHTAQATDFNTTSQSQSAANVRAIQNYHMDVNGWADIGYNFLVDKLGYIFEGRYGSMTSFSKGAHDAVNYNSFGFNVMGYFHPPYSQQPTVAQRNALYDVIAWRMPNPFTGFGSGTYNGKTVGFICGHRNVGSTACPGDNMYQYIGTNYSGGECRLGVNSRITGGGSVTVIVDNTSAGFSASANWWAGSATPGYYGTNYHTRGTAAVSDPAQWTVNLPSSGTYKVYAYWSAGANRPTEAPFMVTHTGGTTTVKVNQQINGGKWNLLGTWSFNQGSAVRVKLSCWTTAGYYVIADAVKFVK